MENWGMYTIYSLARGRQSLLLVKDNRTNKTYQISESYMLRSEHLTRSFL
jgi:hypothetical protein